MSQKCEFNSMKKGLLRKLEFTNDKLRWYTLEGELKGDVSRENIETFDVNINGNGNIILTFSLKDTTKNSENMSKRHFWQTSYNKNYSFEISTKNKFETVDALVCIYKFFYGNIDKNKLSNMLNKVFKDHKITPATNTIKNVVKGIANKQPLVLAH